MTFDKEKAAEVLRDGGEKPAQRYGIRSENCRKAQILDLLRRQRELDGRAL